MKKVLLLLFLFLSVLLFCKTTNNYKIAIGEDVYYSTFSTDTTDSPILYIYRHEVEEQINYYNLDGVTQKYTHKDSTRNIDLTAIKYGKNIILKGSFEQKVIDTIVKLDDAPWKQSMSYSLSEFALGDEEKIEYWIVRLDKFKGQKMQAEKTGIEEITIAGKQYNALKVKISATGLRSKFWSGHYWFRSSDGLFLRYEGLNGLPGSIKTIIEFNEKE
ncbi:MAG: hypothetical protein P9M11_10840 [Candidatus Tenebribacter burtonii]|jgi:hypothetical protein|nr:hypothetical protein [Candidatus Tenebribacter burtonii]